MNKSKCGVIYCASGKKFLREANISARSVKENLEGIKTAIFTDGMYKNLLDENLFDYVIFREKQASPKMGKITCLAESPFEKTLFLDTDTEVLEPVWELFELLDKFDLALTHAPFRASTLSIANGLESFPECNSGVFTYKKSSAVLNFFNEWSNIYKEYYDKNITKKDQPSLRKALYSSSIRFYIIPPEYNLRTIFPYFAGNMKVKILHGRGKSLLRAKKNINNKITLRSGNFNRGYLVYKISELLEKYIYK